MALDEPTENDEIIKDREITYLIEKGLLDQIKPINIDFIDSAMGSGFSITSKLSEGSSCDSGGCGTGCCSSC
jgi:Fe-S cluster assembly iron-binding protein IscA